MLHHIPFILMENLYTERSDDPRDQSDDDDTCNFNQRLIEHLFW